MQKHKVKPPGFEDAKIFNCEYEGCEFFSQTRRGLELHTEKIHSFEEIANETRTIKQEKMEKVHYCERSGNTLVMKI